MKSLNFEDFNHRMLALGVGGTGPIAVAVSGGPDSMALCWLLSRWADGRGVYVHALTVDHGLRPEAADEAVQVGAWLDGWSQQVGHHILRWETPADTAIQEEARRARYGLMAEYCECHDIEYLFLAHHRDDQAETVLFRLAKGSGLDGLSGMQECQAYDERLTLVRPLLDCGKAELLKLCGAEDISYFEDPSNANSDFARVRLRKARCVLEEEGLTSKRLAVTAQRLGRARRALEVISAQAYQNAAIESNTKHIVFKINILFMQPEEVILRCLLKALSVLRPLSDYAPRMERVEVILYDLMAVKNKGTPFRKRTLGGVMFAMDENLGILRLTREYS